MKCQDAQKLISLYVGKDLDHKDELLFHLEECESCGMELIRYQQIHRQFKSLRESQGNAPLPPDFLHQIQQKIHPKSVFYQKHPRFAWFQQQTFLHAAAAILVLAGMVQILPGYLVTPTNHQPNQVSSGPRFLYKKKDFFMPQVTEADLLAAPQTQKQHNKTYRQPQFFINDVPSPASWSENIHYIKSTPVYQPTNQKKQNSSF